MAENDIGRNVDLDRAPVILSNALASLHDLGDGVACFRARSKLNTFAVGVLALLEQTLARVGQDFEALVLGNDDPRAFSAGADLAMFSALLQHEDGPERVRDYAAGGQALFLGLSAAPVPVVAAVQGFALGGGCEFQMHADTTLVHSGAVLGLPETAVGLLPAWGGCTLLLERALAAAPEQGALAAAARVLDTVLAGHPARSVDEARAMGLLRPEDGVVAAREDLLAAAKARALALRPGYVPPSPRSLAVAGPEGCETLLRPLAVALGAGKITATDYALAAVIASVLTGGPEADPARPMTIPALMALECEALTVLVRRPATRARIDHMLATGKRLVN